MRKASTYNIDDYPDIKKYASNFNATEAFHNYEIKIAPRFFDSSSASFNNADKYLFFLGSEGSRTNHAVAFQSAVKRFYNNGLYRNSSEIVYKALNPVKGLVKPIDVNTVKFLYIISTR